MIDALEEKVTNLEADNTTQNDDIDQLQLDVEDL